MRTPPWLYEEMCRLMGVAKFALDAFGSAENSMCSVYCDVEANGLVLPWIDPTFCNPPFSLMTAVVDKAIAEKIRVGLIGPAGCSQKWFQKLLRHAVVYFPDKRLQFHEPDGSLKKGAMSDTAVYIIMSGREFTTPDTRILHVPR
jgi:hypothetical protein